MRHTTLLVLLGLFVAMSEAQFGFGNRGRFGNRGGFGNRGSNVGSFAKGFVLGRLTSNRRGGGFGGGFGGRRPLRRLIRNQVRRQIVRNLLRGKREAEESGSETARFEQIFLQTSVLDADDCVKRFVCELNTKDRANLDDFEQDVLSSFDGTKNDIDVTDTAVEFDLAAAVGSATDAAHCQKLYARCQSDYQLLLNNMEEVLKEARQNSQS